MRKRDWLMLGLYAVCITVDFIAGNWVGVVLFCAAASTFAVYVYLRGKDAR